MSDFKHNDDDCNRAIYTIAEAAEKTGSSLRELLQHGRDGEITFCVRIPNDLTIVSVDQVTLDLENIPQGDPKRMWYRHYLQGREPCEAGEIHRLVLSKSDCKNVISLERFEQNAFRSGLRLDENLNPVRIDPPLPKDLCGKEAGNSVAKLTRYFVPYPKNKRPSFFHSGDNIFSQKIWLAIDDLAVSAVDFEKFLKENPRQIEEVKIDELSSQQMSEKLKNLVATAKYFSEEYSKTNKHPAKSVVAHKLQKEYKFPRYLATAGATIISPGYEQNKINRIFNRIGITNTLRSLLDVSKIIWEKNPNKCPPQKKIEEMLKEKWQVTHRTEMVESIAQYAAQIIRPDKARRGRQPLE